MKPLWEPVIAFVLALVVIWFVITQHDAAVRREALWYRADSIRSVQIGRLQYTADSLERAYRVDTLRLTKTVTKYEQLAGRVDSAWLHDTIRVPVEVVREIKASADTAIRACTAVRLTCEQRVGVLTAWKDSATASAAANRALAFPSIGQRAYTMGRDYLILRAVEAAAVAILKGK